MQVVSPTIGFSNLFDSESFNYGRIVQLATLEQEGYAFIDVKIDPTKDISYLKERVDKLLGFCFIEVTFNGARLYYAKNKIVDITYLTLPESIVITQLQIQFKYPFTILQDNLSYASY